MHYFAPTDPLEMGRYNDPTGITGICYTADYAVVAIAESLGRHYQHNKAFILGLSDLKKLRYTHLQLHVKQNLLIYQSYRAYCISLQTKSWGKVMTLLRILLIGQPILQGLIMMV